MYLKDRVQHNAIIIPKNVNNILYHLKCYLGLIITAYKLLYPLTSSPAAITSLHFSWPDSDRYGRVKQRLGLEDKKGKREETWKQQICQNMGYFLDLGACLHLIDQLPSSPSPGVKHWKEEMIPSPKDTGSAFLVSVSPLRTSIFLGC